MAGGGGERFWPKSRRAYPKQLLSIFGENSMIAETVGRIGPLVAEDRLFVITNEIQAPLIRMQLPHLPKEAVIPEPCGRDTAACIALGAALVLERDPQGIMIVLPADHVIKDRIKLIANLTDACLVARRDHCLVTFGIRPTGPATGYGYIHSGENIQGEGTTSFATVKEFTEKPDRATAERYLKSGDYYWNSGIFVWEAASIVNELKKQMPALYAAYEKMRKTVSHPGGDDELRKIYEPLEKVSIDYGIMEKAERVAVARAAFDWDDAGAWNAVERHNKTDKNGNVILGESVALETKNCIIVSDDGIVGCIGVQDLIVVKTKDAVLVCPKAKAQEIKKVVKRLKDAEHLRKYL